MPAKYDNKLILAEDCNNQDNDKEVVNKERDCWEERSGETDNSGRRLQNERNMSNDTMDDGTNESASGSPSKDNNESETLTMDPRCGASPPASACVSFSGEILQGLAEIGVLSSVPLPELPFLVLH